MALFTAPDGKRSPPVTLAGEGPVHVVAQPVAEAAPLYVVGDPVNPLVLAQEVVEDGGRPRVPGPLGVVQERRPAAPAVRVGMLVHFGPEQQVLLPQLLD